MVSIQVKLGMVGVCGSRATVPGPRGGEMGIPGCVPVSLWAVPVTTVWLSVVSGPDSQWGSLGCPESGYGKLMGKRGSSVGDPEMGPSPSGPVAPAGTACHLGT